MSLSTTPSNFKIIIQLIMLVNGKWYGYAENEMHALRENLGVALHVMPHMAIQLYQKCICQESFNIVFWGIQFLLYKVSKLLTVYLKTEFSFIIIIFLANWYAYFSIQTYVHGRYAIENNFKRWISKMKASVQSENIFFQFFLCWL